jgi:hypothetical protein
MRMRLMVNEVKMGGSMRGRERIKERQRKKRWMTCGDEVREVFFGGQWRICLGGCCRIDGGRRARKLTLNSHGKRPLGPGDDWAKAG